MCKIGFKLSQKSKDKISVANIGKNIGKNNGTWKEKPSYFAVHTYIRRYKNKPDKCELCDKVKKLELMNKDHTYKRAEEDYMYVCRSCHRKWDVKYNNYPVFDKVNYSKGANN